MDIRLESQTASSDDAARGSAESTKDKASKQLKAIYTELGRSYAMLQGVARNEVAVAYTMADAIKERLEQIEGSDIAMGEVERLSAMETGIDALVERLKVVSVDDLEQQLQGAFSSDVSGTEGVTSVVVPKSETSTVDEGVY